MGAPKEPSLSRIVTEDDIRFYVQQFQKSGFRCTEWCPERRRGLVSTRGCGALGAGRARFPAPRPTGAWLPLLTCPQGREAHHQL